MEYFIELIGASLVVQTVNMGLIPGSGRSPGGGHHGHPLQNSCLENPRDRGAWWAAVYGVAQSQTQLKQLSSSSSSRITCRANSVFTFLGPSLQF